MRLFILILLSIQCQYFTAQEFVIRQPVNFLALGDSYTIGQSVAQDESWPYQFKGYLESNNLEVGEVKVIARTGWTTSNLKDAIKKEDLKGRYNLVSLLIGVNNQYQGINIDLYVKEFDELLDTAIYLAGGTDYVFVLSIPDYGYTPFGESNQERISQEIDEYNQINKSITESKGVAYFNITDISRDGLTNPSLVASDRLHPSGTMYGKWVDLIASEFNKPTSTADLREGVSGSDNGINAKVNLEGRFINFELGETAKSKDYVLEIYNLKGQKVLSNNLDSSMNIYLKKTGAYIYWVKSKNRVIYRGKAIIY